MKLRKLEYKDALLMLEWMHDKSIVEKLQSDFGNKTLEDCKKIIESTTDESKNMHLAIVDNKDEYMGTVSIKNITDNDAEFAITIRKCAMGKGYARFAMTEILRIGLEDLRLNMIYWYVSKENIRAIKFYDKNGYSSFEYSGNDIRKKDYIWYQKFTERIISKEC